MRTARETLAMTPCRAQAVGSVRMEVYRDADCLNRSRRPDYCAGCPRAIRRDVTPYAEPRPV